MKDLVLLHGALGASSQLDPLAEALRPHFRVHQMDFEGHGQAAPRGRPFRMQHFAEDVVEVLDRLALQQAAFFGYSMGGYAALHLALEHPDRVERVATLGTKFRWHPAYAEREAARLDPGVIRARVPAFAAALEARHAGAGGWEGVLAGTADLLHHLAEHPLLTENTLPEVRTAARVIVGDRDNTVTVEESSAVASLLAAGSLTVLPDTPHPIEQVDIGVLVPVLREFLN
jgi:pimeloyl-ACP methyl ester carboxylesterase